MLNRWCWILLQDMWKCSCVAGYTGLRCETKMDLCANNTCAVSSSTCQPMPQMLNYTCNCFPGERWVIFSSVVLISLCSRFLIHTCISEYSMMQRILYNVCLWMCVCVYTVYVCLYKCMYVYVFIYYTHVHYVSKHFLCWCLRVSNTLHAWLSNSSKEEHNHSSAPIEATNGFRG